VALGAWLRQNGEAIYGTRPWSRAEGQTADGLDVRFTQKADALYATVLGEPKGTAITLKSVMLQPGSEVVLLGNTQPLKWKQAGEDVAVTLPATLPGKYAYVLRLHASAEKAAAAR